MFEDKKRDPGDKSTHGMSYKSDDKEAKTVTSEDAIEEEANRIKKQMEDDKAALEAEKKEVDWNAVYEWAFGYTKDNTPENRMAQRFAEKHGKSIKGNRGQIETLVLELYKETL